MPTIRDEDLVCWISMVGAEVRQCRPDCRAYRTWNDRNSGEVHSSCVFVSSINQISMVMNSKKGKQGG